jgi:hypothetical protein
VTEGATFNFTPSASDSDVPTNSLTYSLITAPLAITINTNTGRLTWVTAEKDGPDTNQITIRVTDNGSPRLWSQQTFNLIVNEANVAPVLILSNAASATVKLADFENYNDGTFNGTVLFRQPGFSGSTLSFLDTAAADATTVTTNSPGTVRSSVLKASFAFKTNQVNPWLRLTTFNPASLPNPTVDCGKHVKFDLYSSKSIKVCLGIRETGTGAPLGADGGTSGAIEFVGASGKNGNAPIPTRTVAANTWTTLDFDLPNESAAPMTGDGILSPIKGVLENIAIVPNGGSGVHNVYFDNFQVFSSSTNLTVNVGEEISLRCTATDADLPPQTLTFSLDPGAPAGAEISEDGIFNWTPTPAQGPATNVITVRVTDDGSPALTETKNVTIKVLKPNTPPQIAGLEDDIIVENGSGLITFDVTAWDDDLPAQTLTFSLASAPAGASISPGTGAFAWTPPVGLSTNEVTVRVADNGVPPLYVEAVFTLIIVPSNAPPSLSPISDQSVYAGVWLSFIVNATDPDASSQPCFFNVDGPAESGINETNGVFSWRPNQADIGTNSVTVYVTDQPANGGIPKSDSQTFAVIVKAPPAVRLAASGANFVLTWEAISGKTYRVQYKNNLNDSAWLDLSPDITASGESVSIAVPKDTAKRFYRLALIE